MKIEAEINNIIFETHESGSIRALLNFSKNEHLSKLNFEYLSIPVDESVTENSKLCITKKDTVLLEFNNNNLQNYEIRRYQKGFTELPVKCVYCQEPLIKTNNLHRKVKRIECINHLCNAQSRSSLFRLFYVLDVDTSAARFYMNNHYSMKITHLWDLVLIFNQNNSNPNTEPRQKMWNGNNEMWEIEKSLYDFLINSNNITKEQFDYIGFGLDKSSSTEVQNSIQRVIENNQHSVKQLALFFKSFGLKK